MTSSCAQEKEPEAPIPTSLATKSPQFGVAFGNTLIYKSAAELGAALDDVVTLGGKWVRADLSWANMAPNGPERYDWAPFDRVVAAANERGLQVLPVVAYTPPWARVGGCYTEKCAPADLEQFATFARDAAIRYAGLGIDTWEVWNEPNITAFWQPTPDPQTYARLLENAARAIRSVDKDARILLGGLSQAGSVAGDLSASDFVAEVSRLGANRIVDAVAVHPYTYPYLPSTLGPWISPWAQNSTGIQLVRERLAQAGTPNMPLWITEYGAPTGGPGPASEGTPDYAEVHPDHVTEAQQARIAVDAVRLVWGSNDIETFIWYSDKDIGRDPTTPESYFGLRRADGSAKPAFDAIAEAISVFTKRCHGGAGRMCDLSGKFN